MAAQGGADSQQCGDAGMRARVARSHDDLQNDLRFGEHRSDYSTLAVRRKKPRPIPKNRPGRFELGPSRSKKPSTSSVKPHDTQTEQGDKKAREHPETAYRARWTLGVAPGLGIVV